MPTNVTVEYAKAEERYINAKTKEDKISALEEMIRLAPSHKGAEKLRAELKRRLAKLKSQKEAKVGRKTLVLRKEGDARVSIIGFTQSGKSTILSKLTNAKVKISNHPYTTSSPEVGTLEYGGVKIQMVEIPSTFYPMFMSIVQSSDGIVILANSDKEFDNLMLILSKFRIKLPFIKISKYDDLEKVKDSIWDMLGLIRVFTKEPKKRPESKPLVLKSGSTVEDAARRLHKNFLTYFKFARVWGSTKYPGEKVGLEYKLKDKDILEIHMI